MPSLLYDTWSGALCVSHKLSVDPSLGPATALNFQPSFYAGNRPGDALVAVLRRSTSAGMNDR